MEHATTPRRACTRRNGVIAAPLWLFCSRVLINIISARPKGHADQYRGQQLVREVDLYDFRLRGIRSDVEKLQAGDTILVPPVGPEVAVAGMVRRPAVYELKGDTNIQDVLELAGGVLVSANLNQIEVERIEAHQRRVSLSVNLPIAAPKSKVAFAEVHSNRAAGQDAVTRPPN